MIGEYAPLSGEVGKIWRRPEVRFQKKYAEMDFNESVSYHRIDSETPLSINDWRKIL